MEKIILGYRGNFFGVVEVAQHVGAIRIATGGLTSEGWSIGERIFKVRAAKNRSKREYVMQTYDFYKKSAQSLQSFVYVSARQIRSDDDYDDYAL